MAAATSVVVDGSYFRPGHETHPTYFNADVRRVIANAVGWAAQPMGAAPTFGNRRPLEPL